MLNVARQVRPKLYVVADLVTNSDEEENYFVNRLRINSVIKGELYAQVYDVVFISTIYVLASYVYTRWMYSVRVCVYLCIIVLLRSPSDHLFFNFR